MDDVRDVRMVRVAHRDWSFMIKMPSFREKLLVRRHRLRRGPPRQVLKALDFISFFPFSLMLSVMIVLMALFVNRADTLTCRQLNGTTSAFTAASDVQTVDSNDASFTVCYSWALRIALNIPGGSQGT